MYKFGIGTLPFVSGKNTGICVWLEIGTGESLMERSFHKQFSLQRCECEHASFKNWVLEAVENNLSSVWSSM